MDQIEKYGVTWPTPQYSDPAMIEMFMIRSGGFYKTGDGTSHGNGLLFHYLQLRRHLWPQRWTHKWIELIYREIVSNSMVVLMGSASCGKTSTAVEFCLQDYFCFPENTLVLMSTTTREKLESALFGECKMLFRQARELRPWLPGTLIDYKQIISTDNLEDDEVRDLRKGIAGKACYQGHNWVGIGAFSGIKQERVRFIGDELSFMAPSFLKCLDNMFSNPDVKVIGSGNPKHDPDDQLGIAAEPKDGWASVEGIEKTTVWETNFFNGRCINLIGTDSPNFDVPEGQPEPFPRLIGRRFKKLLEDTHGANSAQVETQVKGRMCLKLAHDRVITRQICREHRAHDKAEWLSDEITKIFALDPAYGGEDRCVLMRLDFGKSVNGTVILKAYPPSVLKISVKDGSTPEEQIAQQVFDAANAQDIPAQNIFYDSFGKGTVGFAFARVFGSNCPVPVHSGGRTSRRAVRQDFYVFDEVKRTRRLKRCDEYYSKFVTEMWFSVRYAIEAEQVRELPIDVMLEFCQREYETVSGDKLEVETKEKMQERTGKSPDLADAMAVGVEGARRRGFEIRRLGKSDEEDDPFRWMSENSREHFKWIKSKQLSIKS